MPLTDRLTREQEFAIGHGAHLRMTLANKQRR
jgi:hypothetical protein